MNGQQYKKILQYAFARLKANAEEVNDLNVFPIPDGDTGDNMCSTMNGGVSAVSGINDVSLKAVSIASAKGMLLNARGNSGVILSQIFAGINDVFSTMEEADLYDVVTALDSGVKKSYGAVEKPTEGTILTVFREAVEYAKSKSKMSDGLEFVGLLVEGANISLENTPELLDVLKEAGVVDSGGKGICYLLDGVLSALKGEEPDAESAHENKAAAKDIDFSLFTEDSVMKFGYCTEFLLQLTKAKTDISKFDIDKFIADLRPLGDSIVAFLTGTVVKVHIHSFNPDRILKYALTYGEFLTMKMENMTLQHNETLVEKPKYKVNNKRKKDGVVTVATGEGLTKIFSDQGADAVIVGGQGNNPSLQEFLTAYDAVNADEIFVLPNNGNILLVANASATEYKGSKIWVVPSKSLGEGYAALSMLDLTLPTGQEVFACMVDNMSVATTGMICKATREANINSVEIKKDDYVGFSGKNMLCDHPERLQAAKTLLEKLDLSEKDFLIALYGKNTDQAERDEFEDFIAKNHPNIEFYGVDGGQDVYDYVFILE